MNENVYIFGKIQIFVDFVHLERSNHSGTLRNRKYTSQRIGIGLQTFPQLNLSEKIGPFEVGGTDEK